jgi:glycosyltransferase involved in cell wall biosynthesis
VPMRRAIAPWSDLRAMLALRRIVRRSAPDIVHLHGSKAGLVGRVACQGLKCKVVYTPHAYFYLAKQGVARQVLMLAERVLDRLSRSTTLGTSPAEQRRAIEDIGCPPSRVEYILNAVDAEPLYKRSATQVHAGVVMVAGVSPQKNISMYLDVVRHLRNTTDVPCYLIGVSHDESDWIQLLHMLKAAGLTEDDLHVIEWLPRSHMLELLAGAAVVVSTSRYESFASVLAEANGLGVPVVGTDVDGVRDVIRHGKNGYLVPLGNVEAMAGYIELLLKRPDIWAASSAAASNEAIRRFDIRLAIPKFEAFYARQAYEY